MITWVLLVYYVVGGEPANRVENLASKAACEMLAGTARRLRPDARTFCYPSDAVPL
jgi:hypothetical protein